MSQPLKIDEKLKEEWGKTFLNIPGWDNQKLKNAKVLVVGAGALGNEVVKGLTLLNVGNIAIVDFDEVELDNLAKSILFRQEDQGKKKVEAMMHNLKKINNNVKVLPIVGDISTDVGLGVFRRVDVVISCLDNRLARLHVNRNCFRVNKKWVDGALENLAGMYGVYGSGKSCYECGLSDEAKEIIEYRMGCPDIAKRNASYGRIATTPISSSIIGAFQVQEALKVIFGNEENILLGEAFRYDGMNNFFLKYKQPKLKPDCESHEYYDQIIEASMLSHENTVSEVLDWAEEYFKTKNPKILTRENIVLEVLNSRTGKGCLTAISKNHIIDASELMDLDVKLYDQLHVVKSTWTLDRDFPYPQKTLKEMKIPFLEILKIEANQDIHYVEFTGDENKFEFK